MKIAVAQRESRPFLTDAGAILVGNRSAREFDILDGSVRSLNDPNAFPLCVSAMRVKMGAPTDTPDGEVVAAPGGHVSGIESGIDFNGIAVLGRRRGLAGRFQFARGPYLQGPGRSLTVDGIRLQLQRRRAGHTPSAVTACADASEGRWLRRLCWPARYVALLAPADCAL